MVPAPSTTVVTSHFPSHLPADSRFRLIQGTVRAQCTEEEIDELIQLHRREPLHTGNVPSWLTLLQSGEAYCVPLVDGNQAVKILYLHRTELPSFTPGFLAYRDQLDSNRDGAGTAFTTSFTPANSFLVATVAHSAQTHDNSTGPRRAWLQRFNGLVGDLSGELSRAFLSPEYCALLDTRAEITKPPCPGSSSDWNRYIMSIQINCSHPDRQVAGTAGATHRDVNDDPLTFSVAFNASVLRPGSQLGHFLFPSLGCAVPM
ncbi:MAG: hypothetical protein M1816_002025 [Peltula sp. TS41687]|nr:MAG: hypothetical protein M1816_002025 [Peltula sp. TS41687]